MDQSMVNKALETAQTAAEQAQVCAAPVVQKWSEQLLQWLQQAGELASNEVPEIAKQIAVYGFASNTVTALFLLIGMIITIKLAKFSWNFFPQTPVDFDEEPKAVAYAIFGMANVVATAVLFINLAHYTERAVFAFFAPKVYVIEYLTQLLK